MRGSMLRQKKVCKARRIRLQCRRSKLKSAPNAMPFSGLTRAAARDLIWRLLAEGAIRLSTGRESLRLSEEEPAQKVVGTQFARRDDRYFPDKNEDNRRSFERDRDRILYTSSFRRLCKSYTGSFCGSRSRLPQ